MSIYKKFCNEITDDNGALAKLELKYPENFNFGYDVVDAISKAAPDKRALVWCNTENEERIFTFADLSEYSNKIANVFKSAGIGRGDRVMLILKRHYEYWFSMLALHKLGAVAIPATHMLTEKDIIYRINMSQAKAIVCTPQNEVPGKISAAVKKTDLSVKLWCVQKNIEGFENLTAQAEKMSADFDRVDTLAEDPMLIYFTSGTTGSPKGVIHNFAYPLAHIFTAKYWHRAENDGLHFTVAETGWAKASWGKLYGEWLVGSAVMVFDFDNFDPKQLVTVINKYSVTSFCAPPTVYRYLVRKGVSAMPALKYAATAGETLSPEVFRKFEELTGLAIYEGYGQTETTLLTANFLGREHKPGSLGNASPLYDVEIRRKDGSKAEANELGEIVVVPKGGKAPAGILCGYLNNDEQYKYVWRNGVYHTGDSAFADENGYYWFHGRFDDIIKTGGFRVGPYEIENVLMQHPAVLECSVIGVPDALRGQAIKAIIVTEDGFEHTFALEKEIKDFCNSRLAEYKWLRIVEFVSEMPKTISGKIRKKVQRSNAMQGRSG